MPCVQPPIFKMHYVRSTSHLKCITCVHVSMYLSRRVNSHDLNFIIFIFTLVIKKCAPVCQDNPINRISFGDAVFDRLVMITMTRTYLSIWRFLRKSITKTMPKANFQLIQNASSKKKLSIQNILPFLTVKNLYKRKFCPNRLTQILGL